MPTLDIKTSLDMPARSNYYRENRYPLKPHMTVSLSGYLVVQFMTKSAQWLSRVVYTIVATPHMLNIPSNHNNHKNTVLVTHLPTKSYQPINLDLRYSKVERGRDLVQISLSCSRGSIFNKRSRHFLISS